MWRIDALLVQDGKLRPVGAYSSGDKDEAVRVFQQYAAMKYGGYLLEFCIKEEPFSGKGEYVTCLVE